MALATSLWRESLLRSLLIQSMRSFTRGAMSLRRAATRASGDQPLMERSSAKMASNLWDRLEGDRRDHLRLLMTRRGRDVGKLEQLAARMRPAAGFGDRSWSSIRGVELVEPGIGVGLKDPTVA